MWNALILKGYEAMSAPACECLETYQSESITGSNPNLAPANTKGEENGK